MIAMFKRTLLFSQGAATALYNDQAVQDLDTLREIDDDMTKEMCRVIRKPGEDVQGYGISELSLSRLKLLAFWAKHESIYYHDTMPSSSRHCCHRDFIRESLPSFSEND